MKKSELLADLQNKVLRVFGEKEQPDTDKNAEGIKVYTVEVLERKDTTAVGRTIVFYVLDEGQPDEAAYYKDEIETPAPYQNAVVQYLSSLGFIRFEVTSRHPVLGYCIADVWKDNNDGTAEKQQIIAFFKPNGDPDYRVVV